MMLRRVLRMPLVLLLTIVMVAACGITPDEEPSELARGLIPDSLVAGQLPAASADDELVGDGELLFMVRPDNQRLIEVPRGIGDDPSEVLESLLLGPTFDERRVGISSAMTRATSVEDVTLSPLFQLATVTLAANSLNPDSREQLLAYGQFVFTLTALDGIELVQFEALNEDGSRVLLPVQTDAGLVSLGQSVGRADYASIDPGFNIIVFADDDAATDVPTPTPTPTLIEGALIDVPIWVVDINDDLVPAAREAERSVDALLQSLFDGLTTAEREAGLRSAVSIDAISSGVTVIEVESDDGSPVGTAVVDLTADSLPAVDDGDQRVLAVGQIVLTLTGLQEIDQVLFTIDGQPTSMPTQFGISDAFDPELRIGLRRSDYAAYAPSVRIIDRDFVISPSPTPEPATDGEAETDGQATEQAGGASDGASVEPEPTPTPGG